MSELFADPDTIVRGNLTFVPLRAEHFFEIEPQASQATQYGIPWADMEWSACEAMAAAGGCWTALRGGAPIAIVGVNETFAGVQGVVWAILGEGIGRDHHALTRFLRDDVIDRSPLVRLEAIVRCAEPPADACGSHLVMMTYALQHPTPQVRWALAVGMLPAIVLQKFGAAGESHMLLERIRV